MVRNVISSAQNENLVIIIDIVTINWSQNLILSTRIVKKGCLGVLGLKNAETLIITNIFAMI